MGAATIRVESSGLIQVLLSLSDFPSFTDFIFQITNELFSRLSLSVQKEIVVILIEEHFKCSIELTETAVAIKAILTSVRFLAQSVQLFIMMIYFSGYFGFKIGCIFAASAKNRIRNHREEN